MTSGGFKQKTKKKNLFLRTKVPYLNDLENNKSDGSILIHLSKERGFNL